MNIMELRNYARAKERVENAGENTVLGEWEKFWVFEIEGELMARRKKRQQERVERDNSG